MKISINVVLARCTLFYFQYPLQLTLQLVATLFVLSLVPALKQQFNELINGKSQTNRDQKSNLLFLQRYDQSQKFRIKPNFESNYWYLIYVGFKFEPHVCDKCHDILMTAYRLKTLQY